jgi:anti-sigma B factor antagonist
MGATQGFDVVRRPCDQPGVTLLAASGDIDMTAAAEFGRRLEDALRASSGHVVLDLLEVVHLDSTALRSLLAGRQLAEERGASLVLVCPRGVKHVLEVTGLDRLFEIHAEREPALESIGRRSQPNR